MNVDSDLRVNKPQLEVSFDRDRAEDLGVPVGDVATTLQVLLGGSKTGTFTRANKQYDVIVQLDPRRARDAERHDRSLHPGPQRVAGQARGARDGQGGRRAARAQPLQPGARRHADGEPGAGLHAGRGARLAQRGSPARSCRRGSSTALAGESRELEESGSSLYFAFLLALVVVFMVLASQFESLVHPFTVLLSVPLAVTGALFTLKMAGSTINVYSQIGMILLIGLVTKNSILLVEYINQLRERGMRHHRGRAGGRPHPAPADPHDLGRHGHGRAADRPRAWAPARSAAARSATPSWVACVFSTAAHAVRGARQCT